MHPRKLWFLSFVMLVNPQLQLKAIKHWISGCVKKKKSDVVCLDHPPAAKKKKASKTAETELVSSIIPQIPVLFPFKFSNLSLVQFRNYLMVLMQC